MTRAATAAVFAALLVVAGVVIANQSGGGSENPRPAAATPVVAWLDKLPVDDPPPPACVAKDLDTTLGRTGAWHGNTTQLVVFRNTGSPCRFPTDIGVTATSAVTSSFGLPTEPKLLDQTLVTGQSMYFLIGGPPCRKPTTTVTLDVLIGTTPLAELSTEEIPIACGRPAILDAYAEQIEPPTQSLKLSATITAPESAQAGADLAYTVTLTNGSGDAIAFDKCPAYTESLKTNGVSKEYELNCSAPSELAAGASRVYKMVLAVPADARGHDVLSWGLAGYRATAHVEIDIDG